MVEILENSLRRFDVGNGKTMENNSREVVLIRVRAKMRRLNCVIARGRTQDTPHPCDVAAYHHIHFH